MDTVLALLQNDLFQKVVVFLITAIGGVKFLKNRAVQKWAEVAFRVVEENARINEDAGKPIATEEKIKNFAVEFRKFMKNAGWWVVLDSDVAQAQSIAKAINIIYTNGQEAIASATALAKDKTETVATPATGDQNPK